MTETADSGEDGDWRLGHLHEAPGLGKVPGSHLLEDEDLESISVGSGEERAESQTQWWVVVRNRRARLDPRPAV